MNNPAPDANTQNEDEVVLPQTVARPSLFKKIGRLLSDRWPEYILEIIVVIIGITISFAIGNMKDEASNRTLSQMYLSSLLEDISSDVDELDRVIKQTQDVIRSAHTLIEKGKLNSITIGKSEFTSLVRSVVNRPLYISKNATFSALKSSGHFHLIKDNQLKNLLFEYDQQYQGLKAMEMAELQVTASITGPYIVRHIPLDTVASRMKALHVENIIREVEFANNVELRLSNRVELMESYQEIFTVAKQIKELLQTNLNQSR